MSLAQTSMVAVLTFSALALLSVVLAYWTWVWLAPRAEVSLPTIMQGDGQHQAAYDLFGRLQQSQVETVPSGGAISLFGVVASSDGQEAYALLQTKTRPVRVVRVGEDVVPGVKLVQVNKSDVVLERKGVGETLSLPERRTLVEAASHEIEK